MAGIQILYLAVGGLGCFLLAWFAFSSLAERRPRAAIVSVVLCFSLSLIWFVGPAVLHPSDGILLLSIIIFVLPVILFFLPWGKNKLLSRGVDDSRFDERDTMFAREEYVPGTQKYDDYYAMRPENKQVDDLLRRLPELLQPGGRYYDPVRSGYIEALFQANRELVGLVDGEVNTDRQHCEPATMTPTIKDLVRHLGADEVGIAELDPRWIYSHVGRGPEKWGSPIEQKHRQVIVFTLEMRYRKVEEAPDIGITEETAVRYLDAATLSVALAYFIRNLGYGARAHIAGSNYQLILPAVAADAGLGELGRLGYLISPKYGPRVRLGAVTTDLPLIPDKPVAFGVREFCEICKKCATNCPSHSIPFEGRSTVRGVEKWPLHVESCMKYWRIIGTDCGWCMKVCPYSHPPTFLHNFVRAGIRRSAVARRLALWGDDLFYGRKTTS